MQAALRAALGEVAHGLSTGLVLLAGCRCPDCAPVVHCPAATCPAVQGPAPWPAAPPSEGRPLLLLFCVAVLAFFSGAVVALLAVACGSRLVAGPQVQRFGSPPRRGVWGGAAVRDGPP